MKTRFTYDARALQAAGDGGGGGVENLHARDISAAFFLTINRERARARASDEGAAFLKRARDMKRDDAVFHRLRRR